MGVSVDVMYRNEGRLGCWVRWRFRKYLIPCSVIIAGRERDIDRDGDRAEGENEREKWRISIRYNGG